MLKIFAKNSCKWKQIKSDQIPACVNVPEHLYNQDGTKIFQGETKLLSKSTSKQNYVCKRHPKDSLNRRIDFSLIEITFKKYFKIKWKIVNIFLSTYRRNIDIESTLIRCDVSIGFTMLNNLLQMHWKLLQKE